MGLAGETRDADGGREGRHWVQFSRNKEGVRVEIWSVDRLRGGLLIQTCLPRCARDNF